MTPGTLTLPAGQKVPIEAAREIDNFEAEVNRFLSGELAPERFRAFRLGHGVYGQRQPGVQMVRVKIPGGALRGAQILRLAEISETFGNGLAHLTTRQDVQFHFVQLENVPHVMRLLAEAGLTTREACGNSVRNVTACPLSGFIAEEAFAVEPYAQAAYAYLARNPFCQQLARKFKIAFSACPEDCAATAIHDIGALGRVVVEEGRTRIGFRVVVGGGLGPTPFVAERLSDFVPLDRFLPTVKAILKVFSAHGNRRNRTRARLKFVVHRMGIERFRDEVAAALAGLAADEIEEADLRRLVPPEWMDLVEEHLAGDSVTNKPGSPPSRVPPATEPLPSDLSGVAAGGANDDAAYHRWLSCSVRPHRDPDRAVVTVLIPLGDLAATRLRALSLAVTEYAEDHARVGREQNLVLPSVRRSDLRTLYDALAEIGLAEAGVGTALDVTSCPGADTCNLGITSSKGLTRALREEISSLAAGSGIDALRGLAIKISGCPNSCGQHHVAGIGFHGVVKKIGGRQVPAYQIHLGGSSGQGEARIGTALDKIPARNVPAAVAAILRLFQRERLPSEPFADFVTRMTIRRLSSVIAPFASTAPEDHSLDLDWGQTEPFTTDDLGTGECAGAGTDGVTEPFEGCEAELRQTALFMERDQWADALANLNRTQYSLARVLLEKLGKHPDSDYECACEMRAHVIDRGYAGDLWNDHHEEIGRLLKTRRPGVDDVRRLHQASLELLAESRVTLGVLAAAAQRSAGEIPG